MLNEEEAALLRYVLLGARMERAQMAHRYKDKLAARDVTVCSDVLEVLRAAQAVADGTSSA